MGFGGVSGHVGVGQTQKILEIPDPIEVPVPVRRPCAGVVLVGTEIHLTRQGQPEPDQRVEQFLAISLSSMHCLTAPSMPDLNASISSGSMNRRAMDDGPQRSQSQRSSSATR